MMQNNTDSKKLQEDREKNCPIFRNGLHLKKVGSLPLTLTENSGCSSFMDDLEGVSLRNRRNELFRNIHILVLYALAFHVLSIQKLQSP